MLCSNCGTSIGKGNMYATVGVGWAFKLRLFSDGGQIKRRGERLVPGGPGTRAHVHAACHDSRKVVLCGES